MTKIAWTRVTCNVFPGCCKVSEGCRYCYAEGFAKRLKAMGQPQYRDVVDADGWTGKVQTNFAALRAIAARKKPTMVFVNSMGDFFFERISDALRDAALGIMLAAQQHIWQILTKRPKEAARYFEGVREEQAQCGEPTPFGVEHIWLGVTAEDQVTADERIALLPQLPAVVRFVSAEPLLSPIQIRNDPSSIINSLSWLILGCESRQGRPGRFCGPEFFSAAQELIVQCRAAGVPVFVKQVPSDDGKRVIHDPGLIAERLGYTIDEIRQWPAASGAAVRD